MLFLVLLPVIYIEKQLRYIWYVLTGLDTMPMKILWCQFGGRPYSTALQKYNMHVNHYHMLVNEIMHYLSISGGKKEEKKRCTHTITSHLKRNMCTLVHSCNYPAYIVLAAQCIKSWRFRLRVSMLTSNIRIGNKYDLPQKFNMFCSQRCFSTHHNFKDCLFELP